MRGIIIGIILFFALVLIHEFGHFLAAKRSGVKVEEFGIGIPPKLGTIFTDKKGTKYTINALPLGGFVRLKGDDPQKPDEFHAPDSFMKAKLHRKILILLGGVLMNFIGAWALFTFVFTVGTQPISILPENAVAGNANSYLMPTINFLDDEGLIEGDIIDSPALVSEVFEGGLGSDIGLESGDVILDINGMPVSARTITTVLKDYIGAPIEVNISRDGLMLSGSTSCPEDNCLLGVALQTNNAISVTQIKYPFKDAIFVALKEIRAETKLTLNVLGTLGKNLVSFDGNKIKNSVNNLTGPVGAVNFGKRLLEYGGWIAFLGFAGMISLALAIFNILPIPALDGGRLISVLIQSIFKIKPEKYYNIE